MTDKEILDTTKMHYLNVITPNYRVVDACNFPKMTPVHWFILERIHAIMIRCTNMYSMTSGNLYEKDGLKYYWISSALLLRHVQRFGVTNRQTISRIISDWKDITPEIIKTEIHGMGKGQKIYYALTKFSTEMLFNTGDVDVSGILGQQPESESGEQESNNNSTEVPAGTTKDPVNEFPDWFDKQWEVLKSSGRFTSCNKCNPKTDVPYKYATDFAKGVDQLIDGTFYKGVGVWIKDKTIKIPEGLTVESIIEAVLSVEGKLITNPLKALVLQTANMNYSPLLKYWEKNGVAGSSTRSQATSPAAKPITKSSGKSVRTQRTYTAEEYKDIWPYYTIWANVRSYYPDGHPYESEPGFYTDDWLKKHPFLKKYDDRLTNFYLDVRSGYKDAGKSNPSIMKIIDTIVGMAQFRAKEGTQKWEDIFWDIIDQMPIYQDCKLWRWFIERFEHDHGEGQSNCDMYKGNTARKQAQEADAQYRAIEQTARELIGDE